MNDVGQTYHCASTKDHCKFAIFIAILYYYDDNIIIVSEVRLRRINFILQDMGVGSISGKMLKNPHGDEKTKSSVQKRSLVQDMAHVFKDI
jgi:hypothetical protein